MRILLAMLGFTLVGALPLRAQRIPDPAFHPTVHGALVGEAQRPFRAELRAEAAPRDPGVAGLALMGLAGGVAGGVIGARMAGGGRYLEQYDGVVIAAALLGESLGLAAGVHLAAGSDRSLAPSFLASAAIAVGGVALAALADHGGFLLAIPVLQLAATIDRARD